ncbi:phospholipase D-like domain-containing protein [Acidithiobacillus ferrooxidans]|uniref:phospholipase D-like domain-containing protein n=1 Tax=Acidithiobacillus ferrooxidans TaxID=920 RepID=UPI0021473D31|nr:phospholipase D-like domain-containing protein [Acidithiobacillus ferrooxidans]MCR1347490.1 phospholipase D-like domain-containing protein [Acidithiobacillus ferrooxidans]MCR1355357.1 phospholipase D-like domain-containing protein [Acidithiobacillus ferrooxidans]
MLFTEPYVGPAPIVQVISSARREVSLNVYYLSSKPILNALRAAHSRGVTVRVIIDEHPYGMKPWMIQKEVRAVQATGAALHWAPPRFEASQGWYVFDHAKYVCDTHECEIGTANYDWSAFHRNREYLDVTRNPNIVRAANAVFAADWTNQRAPAWTHRVLVLSPGTSVGQMLAVINQPGTVEIESEEMGNDREMLDAIAAKGAQAWVILPASISGQDKRNVAYLVQHGVHVRLMPKRPIYMHAKAEISSHYAFVGSENYSASSLEANREMGLILNNPMDISMLQAQFARDWKAAGAA